MAGDCFDILLRWSIYFIEIYSGSLIFFVSLCSFMMPLELGSGSNVSLETPNLLGLNLRKRRRWARYFAFSVVVRA